MKKFVFLNPCNYNSPSNQSHGPLSFAYIASYLEAQLNTDFSFSIEVDVEQVIKKKPDLVGISAYTESYLSAIAACQKIKKELPEVPVFLGGKHITALPAYMHECFDVGIYGEGEQTTTALVELFLKEQLEPKYLKNIDGITYFHEQERVINKPRTEIASLDLLPKPKREILHAFFPNINQDWYWPQAIYTSRGCPYVCHFCIHSTLKSKTRFHSAERVIEELEDIIRHYPQQKHITIYDDLFAIDKKKVKKISDLIVQEGINKQISFTCMGKADIFDEEFCYLLKRMNVRLISFGFESGNTEILRYLKTDRSKVSDNQKAVDICDKYGIGVGGYFIVGAPQESLKELNQTYWFIRKNMPPMSMFGAFSLTPFPGTQFWSEALAKGQVEPATEDWSKYSYIDFIEGKTLFFNENYSVESFKLAYESFYNLSPQNSVYILNNKDEEDLSYAAYLHSFAIHHIKNLSEINILEISNNYFYRLGEIFAETKLDINYLDSWLFRKSRQDLEFELRERLTNRTYDLIFFNHSLEQLNQPLAFLQAINTYLKPGGKLLILMKNSHNIYELASILLGLSSLNINGFKKFDFFKLLNYELLMKELEQLGYSLEVFQELQGDSTAFSFIYQSVLPVIKKFIPKIETGKLNIANYLMIFQKG